MRQVDNKRGAGFSIADTEDELARARVTFGEGLERATEPGERALGAARRLVVPAMWAAVLVGGAVAVFAVARLLRRRRRAGSLIRIVVEPARIESGLVRPAGAALARLAMERIQSSVADAARANAFTASVSGELPVALGSDYGARLDSSSVQRNSTRKSMADPRCLADRSDGQGRNG